MNHRIFLYVVGLFLIMGIFVTISRTFAQEANEQTGRTSGGAINRTDNTNNMTGGIRSFDPLWLVPLLAIPILLYLLWPTKDDRRRGAGFAGAKGGRAEDLGNDEDYVPEPPRYRD